MGSRKRAVQAGRDLTGTCVSVASLRPDTEHALPLPCSVPSAHTLILCIHWKKGTLGSGENISHAG